MKYMLRPHIERVDLTALASAERAPAPLVRKRVKHREMKVSSADKLAVQESQKKYIQVGINGLQGNPVLISPFELKGYGGKNYNDVHFKLLKNGLYMPTPLIFSTHFNNVVDAFHDKKKLVFADGSEVPKGLVEKMFKHYTENFKNVYGAKDVGAWTWLNARFAGGTGFNRLNLETVVGLKNGGNRELELTSVPLEECLWEDALTDLSFNVQGLSTTKCGTQKYNAGDNICFYYPRENCVAWFDANSGRALLNCDRNPTNTYPALGVFACAEGAGTQKNGGTA